MRRAVLVLLLSSAVALLARPTLADKKTTQSVGEQERTEERGSAEEPENTDERQHGDDRQHSDERQRGDEHSRGEELGLADKHQRSVEHGQTDERQRGEEQGQVDERQQGDERTHVEERRHVQNSDEREHSEEAEHADEQHELEREHDPEQDDDSDSAPFTIVVQHDNGRRCGGSLVSLRTALTSAWCVRGQHGGDPRELWALAPAVPPARPVARRVARVALVAGADSDSPAPHLEPGWGGAALDIAVLELEAPFGVDARSRPILMATQAEDCDINSMCHVVRAVGPVPRLRIVDAELVPGERCGAVANGWPGLRDSALCLAGPELCATDRGAGVVCDGKLCGVLSRSARLTNTSLSELAANKTPSEVCGDVHVAQSVARWRRFLHCAHTLRACGSGGECAKLCSERQLMVMRAEDSASAEVVGGGGGGGGGDGGGGGGDAEAGDSGEQNSDERVANARRGDSDTDAPPTTPSSSSPSETTVETSESVTTGVTEPSEDSSSTRPGRSRMRTSTRLTPTPTTPSPVPIIPPMGMAAPVTRASFEFEPNRADFKGGPARTSRVYLKAGEYGDNAADYGGDESALAPTSSTTPRATTVNDTAGAGRVSELAAQQSAATTPKLRAHAQPTSTRLHTPFIFSTILIYAL